jgi:GMP reductase
MLIDNDLKLDFNDVLIKPIISSVKSRNDVNLFVNRLYIMDKSKSIPIIASNMDTIGTFNMAKSLDKLGVMTCLHKHYKTEEYINFFTTENSTRIFFSVGATWDDLHKLKIVYENCGIENVCLDVANAYIPQVFDVIEKIKSIIKNPILMVGNIATPEPIADFAHSGVKIIKVGIGGGCFIAGTKVLTENGYKNIEKVKVGDKVITHVGRYKTVTNVASRIEKETIIDINGIKCTKDHKFYVIEKKNKNKVTNFNIDKYAKWISAADLSEEHLLIKVTR